MTLTREQFDSIVEDVMTDLPFVDWDRGTEYENDGLKRNVIYGWIDREEDEYKDFVVIGIYEKEKVEKATIDYIASSSSKYSEEIHQRLFPDEDAEKHNECFRLEDKFNIQNLVRIRDKEREGDRVVEKGDLYHYCSDPRGSNDGRNLKITEITEARSSYSRDQVTLEFLDNGESKELALEAFEKNIEDGYVSEGKAEDCECDAR